MRENNRSLTTKLETSEEENSDLRASITAIGSQLADESDQREQMEQFQGEYEDHSRHISSLEKELMEKGEIIADLEKQLSQQQNTPTKQIENNVLQEDEQKQNGEQNTDQKQQNTDQKQQNTDCDQQQKDKIQEVNKTQTAQLQEQLAEACALADKLTQEVCDIKEERDKMVAELQEVNNLMGKLRIECADKDNIVSSLRTEKDSVAQELDTMKSNLVPNLCDEKQALERQLDDTKAKLKHESSKNRQAVKEIGDLKQRMVQLRQDIEVSGKQSKNRINTLEIEVTKGMANKEAVDKMLRRKENEVKRFLIITKICMCIL